jgi:hypothetical protein
MFKEWADDQCNALQSNRHDALVKNDKLIAKTDSTGVTMKNSTVNNAVSLRQFEEQEDGFSSGYEELKAEWVYFGGNISTGSAITTVLFVGDPGSIESIFAYCIGCNDPSHRAMQCQEFSKMPVVQRHGIVRKMGACRKCLKGKHFARDCENTSGGCALCDSTTHHTLLHYENRKMMGREMGGLKGYSRQSKQSGRQAMPNQIQMQNPNRMQAWPSTSGQWANNGNGNVNGNGNGIGNGTANGYMDRTSRKPTVNNDVMFARLDQLTDLMATIGQYITSQIKSTALNMSNKMEAQEQLTGSSKITSPTDDNKPTNTYFRLITFFLVNYMNELVRINGIIDEGSTDSFITRALVEELRLIGVDIWSHIATIGDNVSQVKSKLVEVKMTSIDGKETHVWSASKWRKLTRTLSYLI